MELCTITPWAGKYAASGGVPTRADFDVAVKDALRHYMRADLLLGSPLLETPIAGGHETGPAKVAHLQRTLVEASKTIFVNERDLKLHRVLELTYFKSAPKQEAVAERLGLSFSTYRRYLTAAIERITEWLWHREQETLGRDDTLVEANAPPMRATASTPRGLRPRLSIVILPFLNLSQDPSVDYLVDGIVDNLMTDLSRALPGSFVISRSTAFTYRGRRVPIRQIGEELQVRYALEGSVLADAVRVRVNVQLIDALTDEHLWAERFDKERKDILQAQEEIVARLARSTGVEMVRNEARPGANEAEDKEDAVELVMRGNAVASDLAQKERAVEALNLFTRALERDPDNPDAMIGIASTRVYQVVNQYATEGRETLLDEAEELVSRAVRLAPDHIGVLKARAVLLRARGRFGDAMIAAQSVIAVNPGEPTAYRELGLNNLYLGETEKAVEWFRRADAVAPRDRVRWTWLLGRGRGLVHLCEDEEAATTLRLAVHSNPHYPLGRAFLAAAEALVGNIGQARLHLAKYDELDPGMTIRRFAKERASVPLAAVSPIYLRGHARFLDGLRRAGMPEE